MGNLIISEQLIPRVEAILKEKIEQQSFNAIRVKLEEKIEALEQEIHKMVFTDKISPVHTTLLITSEVRLKGQELYKVYDLIMDENLN